MRNRDLWLIGVSPSQESHGLEVDRERSGGNCLDGIVGNAGHGLKGWMGLQLCLILCAPQQMHFAGHQHGQHFSIGAKWHSIVVEINPVNFRVPSGSHCCNNHSNGHPPIEFNDFPI